MPLRALEPKSSASANSATFALARGNLIIAFGIAESRRSRKALRPRIFLKHSDANAVVTLR